MKDPIREVTSEVGAIQRPAKQKCVVFTEVNKLLAKKRRVKIQPKAAVFVPVIILRKQTGEEIRRIMAC